MTKPAQMISDAFVGRLLARKYTKLH